MQFRMRVVRADRRQRASDYWKRVRKRGRCAHCKGNGDPSANGPVQAHVEGGAFPEFRVELEVVPEALPLPWPPQVEAQTEQDKQQVESACPHRIITERLGQPASAMDPLHD